MKYLYLLPVLLAISGTSFASPVDTPEAKVLMKRTAALTHTGQLIYCYIPPRGNFAKNAETLAKMISSIAKEHQPLVIYSPDSELATRMITISFATVTPNALKGCAVICAVGKTHDSYIRPVIEATGAKLYVEPLP